MTTITVQIDHWQFDAQELGTGTVEVTSNVLNANAATQYIGLLFSAAALADLKGTMITSAYLELYFTSGSFDDPDVTLYGYDADYSTPFLGTTNEISNLTPTAAGVVWSASFIGTGWKTSPDIKTVIQEIIDRPGWPRTGAPYPSTPCLPLVVKGNSSSSLMRVRSYDGDSTQAAKLVISYEAPTSGQPMTARARLVPGMRRPHGSQGW